MSKTWSDFFLVMAPVLVISVVVLLAVDLFGRPIERKIPAEAVPAVAKTERVDSSIYVGRYEDKFVKAVRVNGRFEDGPHLDYSIITDKATGARILCREGSGPVALCLLPPVPVEQTTKPLQKGD